jgi:nitrite reductase (NADH) small subunit
MSETKKWVRIARVENIPVREGRAVEVGGHDVAIFNLGDRFLAVENRCPHRSGPLADGIVSGTTVVCPLHAWKVDLTSGQVTNRPGETACVKSYPAAVRDGVVLVEIVVADSKPNPSHTPCRVPAAAIAVMSARD